MHLADRMMELRIIVGITGASGAVYGWRLLQTLQAANCEVHTVVSTYGWQVLNYECGIKPHDVKEISNYLYDIDHLTAVIASGSFKTDAMVVVPCSMRTLGMVANGIGDNLLTRAADVMLKEGRQLLLVPRETPVNAIHLENMLKLARIGVKIMPASPGFYHQPQDLNGLIDMMVGKICDMLHIKHNLFASWQGL
jgi:flavin prenyltransferase